LFTRKSLGDWSYDASVIFRRNDRVNSHKNARLTVKGRKLLMERSRVMGLRAAAVAAGVSLRTARKWQRRFEEGGSVTKRSTIPGQGHLACGLATPVLDPP